MATPNPFFLYPFASSGDATAITETTGANAGVVNYQYGFTPNYELNLADGGSALPIPRQPFNQLMLDITTALQNLQQFGASPWVSVANGGPPSGYPLYARVGYTPSAGTYSGIYSIWESQSGTNTSTPGSDNNWLPVSNKSLQAGDIIWSAAMGNRQGCFKCDGSAILRVDYPALFAALTVSQPATTNSTTTLTVFSTALLSVGVNAVIEGAGIPSGTYIVSIIDSVTVQMSAAAVSSGSSTMVFFAWGDGDGSTTFNIPYLYRKVPVGAGNLGTGSAILGDYIGQSGGEETHTIALGEMAQHSHSAGIPFVTSPPVGGFGFAGGTAYVYNSTATTGINGFSSQSAMNILQPSVNLWAYIQY